MATHTRAPPMNLQDDRDRRHQRTAPEPRWGPPPETVTPGLYTYGGPYPQPYRPSYPAYGPYRSDPFHPLPQEYSEPYRAYNPFALRREPEPPAQIHPMPSIRPIDSEPVHVGLDERGRSSNIVPIGRSPPRSPSRHSRHRSPSERSRERRHQSRSPHRYRISRSRSRERHVRRYRDHTPSRSPRRPAYRRDRSSTPSYRYVRRSRSRSPSHVVVVPAPPVYQPMRRRYSSRSRSPVIVVPPSPVQDHPQAPIIIQPPSQHDGPPITVIIRPARPSQQVPDSAAGIIPSRRSTRNYRHSPASSRGRRSRSPRSYSRSRSRSQSRSRSISRRRCPSPPRSRSGSRRSSRRYRPPSPQRIPHPNSPRPPYPVHHPPMVHEDDDWSRRSSLLSDYVSHNGDKPEGSIPYPVVTPTKLYNNRLQRLWESCKQGTESAASLATDTIPRHLYLHFLLRIPALYFSRITRVFEDADLSIGDINQMALKSGYEVFEMDWDSGHHYWERYPAIARFKVSWDEFVHTATTEWQVQNVVAVLLLIAVLTFLQIEAVGTDPVSRTAALISLICALMSLLYGCLYMAQFGAMKKLYKAAAWAEEARKIRPLIFWNVWVFLAMPTVWLLWSTIAFATCILTYVWRSGTTDEDFGPLDPIKALGPRIAITAVFGLGLVYLIFIVKTLHHYGSVMDHAWKSTHRVSQRRSLIPPATVIVPPSHFPPSSGYLKTSRTSPSRRPSTPHPGPARRRPDGYQSQPRPRTESFSTVICSRSPPRRSPSVASLVSAGSHQCCASCSPSCPMSSMPLAEPSRLRSSSPPPISHTRTNESNAVLPLGNVPGPDIGIGTRTGDDVIHAHASSSAIPLPNPPSQQVKGSPDKCQCPVHCRTLAPGPFLQFLRQSPRHTPRMIFRPVPDSYTSPTGMEDFTVYSFDPRNIRATPDIGSYDELPEGLFDTVEEWRDFTALIALARVGNLAVPNLRHYERLGIRNLVLKDIIWFFNDQFFHKRGLGLYLASDPVGNSDGTSTRPGEYVVKLRALPGNPPA